MPINHESVRLQGSLPIQIFKRKSNAHTEGCYYHWHELLEIYYVVSGGIYLLCNGSRQWIYPGDIAVVNWCEPHRSLQFLDHTEHYIIQIDTASPLLRAVHQAENSDHSLSISPQLDQWLQALIREYENRTMQSTATICGYTLLILGEILKTQTTAQKPVNRENLIHIKDILSHLHACFTGSILLDDMAGKLGISKSHMCRIFKTHTGNTIVQYLNNLRCHYAIPLMQDGYSVAKAAEAAGFTDYNYFSRVFKRAMGYAPSEAKKQH